MRKIISLALLFLALTGCVPAMAFTVTIALTNFDLTLSTNGVRIYRAEDGDPWTDGSRLILGSPVTIPTTNGEASKDLLPGNYELRIIGYSLPRPIYFVVPEGEGTNSVFNMRIKGINFFKYSPGVQGIILSGQASASTNASGVVSITVSNQNGGSGTFDFLQLTNRGEVITNNYNGTFTALGGVTTLGSFSGSGSGLDNIPYSGLSGAAQATIAANASSTANSTFTSRIGNSNLYHGAAVGNLAGSSNYDGSVSATQLTGTISDARLPDTISSDTTGNAATATTATTATTASSANAVAAGVTNEFYNFAARGFVTPQRFGAVGDASTDDTVALQAWLDYCATNQLVAALPPASGGAYIISSALTLPAGYSITIKGLSSGSRHSTSSLYTKSCIRQTTRGAHGLNFTNANDTMQIEDIMVECQLGNNWTNATAPCWGIGISAPNSADTTKISGVSVKGFSYGVRLGAIADASLRNISLGYNAIGLYVSRTNVPNGSTADLAYGAINNVRISEFQISYNYTNAVYASDGAGLVFENGDVSPNSIASRGIVGKSAFFTLRNIRFEDYSTNTCIILSGGGLDCDGVAFVDSYGTMGSGPQRYSVASTNASWLRFKSTVALIWTTSASGVAILDASDNEPGVALSDVPFLSLRMNSFTGSGYYTNSVLPNRSSKYDYSPVPSITMPPGTLAANVFKSGYKQTEFTIKAEMEQYGSASTRQVDLLDYYIDKTFRGVTASNTLQSLGRNIVYLRDDFFGHNSSIGDLNWAAGGGAGGFRKHQDLTKWGTIEIYTGTTSGQGYYAYLGSQQPSTYTGFLPLSTSGGWTNTWVARLNTTNLCYTLIGFASAIAFDTLVANGIYFRYYGSGTNFEAVCRSSGTETYVASTKTPNPSAYHVFRIWSETAGTIKFSVDGESALSISANVPTAASCAPLFYVRPTEAAAKTNTLDYFDFTAWTSR